MTIKAIHYSFAQVMVCGKVPKDPASAVKINVDSSFLWLTLFVKDRRGLKDADLDLSVFNRAPLLSDAENIRACSTTINGQVLCRILAKGFYRHLMGMEASCIVLVVVLYVDGVKARQQLRRDTIVKRLYEERWA
jgi:hypothetical protein